MASLLDYTNGTQRSLLDSDAPPGLLISPPSDTSVPSWADAATWWRDQIEQQQQLSAQMGLWDPATGLPTAKGLTSIAHQYGDALLAGTTTPANKLANPAFAKWFGDSRMVDEAGNPSVLYHGTADTFDRFAAGQPNQKDSGWLGKGFYFWNEPGLASDYTALKRGDNPNVMPVHLKLENPYYATPQDKERLMLASRSDPFASADFTNDLKDKGHDGVILNYPHKPGLQEVMVFDPTQIKSAISNTGAYSPTDPRLTYGIGALGLGLGAAATQGSQ